MVINDEGLNLIKTFEGFVPTTYDDGVGVLTIGYGTTARAGLGINPTPGMTISEKDAEHYLMLGLEKFAQQIKPKITEPINENEWAAFLSLAYNIGPTAFARSSALRHFNNGDKLLAAKAILLWNNGGGKVMKGLQRRREAERKLFLKPVARVIGAPTPQTFASIISKLFALLFERFSK